MPKPGPTTLRYGGNTSCVEVRADDGTLIVLDCGTGAHELGQALVASGERPLRGHLLITHTHWDHIQGFPFFAPLFVPDAEWDVYAPKGLSQRLAQTLAGQMEYAYFPITLEQLGATVHYHDLVEGAFNVGAVRITTHYLNHPGLALGYRLESGGVAVVYATDHEPHSPHHPGASNPRGAGKPSPVHQEDQRHIAFLAGADLVIHDAQYALSEYPQRLAWGHTPAELAVDFALAAGIKRLALFHHDPLRSDEALDDLVEACRQRVAAAGSRLIVFAAAEGHVVQLEEPLAPGEAEAMKPAALASPAGARSTAPTILIVDDDPDVVDMLTLTLEPEGFRLLSASSGEAALAMARAERPDLIILDWRIPERDGLEVCRILRAEPDPQLRDVPVLLVTGRAEPEDTAAGFAAGVDDYLTKPLKMAHLRSRVHAWLLRRHH
jgi:CheY-like chemotaxis protein/phosphoribosyl 1,2-cyclic phosphodiesterase